jgi:hypothetical protein
LNYLKIPRQLPLESSLSSLRQEPKSKTPQSGNPASQPLLLFVHVYSVKLSSEVSLNFTLVPELLAFCFKRTKH